MIKKFLVILLLSSFLITPLKADDIRDFEIEGLSVGDSLLTLANKEKIKKTIADQQYPNDKFLVYNLEMLVDLKMYDYGTVSTKKNDSNYITTNISGIVRYNKLDECLKLKDEIQTEIEKIFKSVNKQETNFASRQDETGNSKVYGVQNYFKPYPSDEAITINCYHFTPESGIERTLKVSVNTHEYAYFIINEAYK